MNRLAILIASLTLASCASLRVKVDIVNPDVIQKEIDRFSIRDLLPEILAQDDAAVDTIFDDLQNRHFAIVTRAGAALKQRAGKVDQKQGEALRGLADDLQENFRAMRERYSDTRASVKAVNAHIRALGAMGDVTALATLIRTRRSVLQNFRTIITTDVSAITDEADRQLGTGSNVIERDTALFRRRAYEAQKSLVGEANIAARREAFAVVHTDRNNWHKCFDQSWGKGRLGNLDLAIKAESATTFTIKGISFDPSEIPRIAAKVTTQALVLGTQIAGVPIPSKTYSDGSPTSVAGSSGELETLEREQAEKDAQNADRRRALLTLAGAILREKDAIRSNDDEEREAAMEAIRAAWDAHGPRLTTPGGGEE